MSSPQVAFSSVFKGKSNDSIRVDVFWKHCEVVGGIISHPLGQAIGSAPVVRCPTLPAAAPDRGFVAYTNVLRDLVTLATSSAGSDSHLSSCFRRCFLGERREIGEAVTWSYLPAKSQLYRLGAIFHKIWAKSEKGWLIDIKIELAGLFLSWFPSSGFTEVDSLDTSGSYSIASLFSSVRVSGSSSTMPFAKPTVEDNDDSRGMCPVSPA